MSFHANILKLRDHIAAMAASLACAHGIGLIDLHPAIPQGSLLADGLAGQVVGLALSALAYAIIATLLYRHRLVRGPLYRCGETRPHRDYAQPYQKGTSSLLDSWHYR